MKEIAAEEVEGAPKATEITGQKPEEAAAAAAAGDKKDGAKAAPAKAAPAKAAAPAKKDGK